MQASQCAISANMHMRSIRTAAPYSEYLSNFRATLTKRSSLAVFRRPINVVVCKNKTEISFPGQQMYSHEQ